MSDKKDDDWVRTAGGRRVRRSEMDGAPKAHGQDESGPIPRQLDTAQRVKVINDTLKALAAGTIGFDKGFRGLVLAANDIFGSHIAGKTATPDEWADTTAGLMSVMIGMNRFIDNRIEAEEKGRSAPRGPVFIRVIDLGALFDGPDGGGGWN